MKRYRFALGFAALLFAGAALADDLSFENSDFGTAQRCLAYGKKVMAKNTEMLALLNRSTIVRKSVTENRYDEPVGRQHIGTEISAELRDGNQPTALILCLLYDKPLYFFMHPASP
ncbi:hypothetical protein ACFSHT_33610 [Paraburkholderia silviterrae]|uniref:Uncharacterized protein n=1 Tax=Paraburkholderia silviterrae TaxID=2528715 RepID=A0A4R5M2L9_9BURK|nr:hypothetical protein [Paraburkholderia silviterrae]TDG19806.1 hypothetical protein EYW47_28455 [Paraburkholderia silviterrae]